MNTENRKTVFNFCEGTDHAEIVIREGAATKVLDPKPPVKINLMGIIGVPVEFLTKRLSEPDQIDPKRCHVIVDREKITLTLVMNENDEYSRGIVTGVLEEHPKFREFGINSNKLWTPTELGMFFKMNRSFFPDKNVNMKLVTDLMNFTATVNNRIEKVVKEGGDRTDNFMQAVNSNLPQSFMLSIPVFKGMSPENLEVEIFAKINGREISLALFSPAASQILEEIRDRAIDFQVNAIRDLSPEIAIIEQ
jgi:hypothetical protein